MLTLKLSSAGRPPARNGAQFGCTFEQDQRDGRQTGKRPDPTQVPKIVPGGPRGENLCRWQRELRTGRPAWIAVQLGRVHLHRRGYDTHQATWVGGLLIMAPTPMKTEFPVAGTLSKLVRR